MDTRSILFLKIDQKMKSGRVFFICLRNTTTLHLLLARNSAKQACVVFPRTSFMFPFLPLQKSNYLFAFKVGRSFYLIVYCKWKQLAYWNYSMIYLLLFFKKRTPAINIIFGRRAFNGLCTDNNRKGCLVFRNECGFLEAAAPHATDPWIQRRDQPLAAPPLTSPGKLPKFSLFSRCC